METSTHNFVVGSTLQIELTDAEHSLIPALLIGYATGRSLLVTVPEELRDSVAVGIDCVVRFESGDTLYAFDSRILHCPKEPFPYIHLAFPDQTVKSAASVRRSQRVVVNDMVMMLVMEEAGRKMSVALADISLSGARLVAGMRLGDVGERFSIEIPQLGSGNATSQRIALPCRVRYVREEQSSTVGGKRVYHHGVEFTDLNQQALVFIERYIGDKVAEHRGVQA